MSNEELVLLYQQGDSTALEKLIENNKGIINKVVNKFYVDKTNSIDREDLEQEAVIGLIVAVQRYDFNRENKASFITYAFYWIYEKINRFIKNRNTNDETSLNIPLGEEEDMELLDTIQNPDNSYENLEDKLYYDELRSELEGAMEEHTTLFEREVLKLHYGWDMKPIVIREVGEILNSSNDKAILAKAAALRKLRDSRWGRITGRKYISEIVGYDDITYTSVEKKIDLDRYFGEIDIKTKNLLDF